MALIRNGEKTVREQERRERERDHKNFDNCQVHNITEDLMTFIYYVHVQPNTPCL